MNENVIEEKKDINFIGYSTNEKYNHFILPFMVSIFSNIPNSHIEIYINEESINTIFTKKVKEILDINYKNRYLINPIHYNQFNNLFKYTRKFNTGNSKEDDQFYRTLRWLTIPRKQCEYTYIGDIDIIYLNVPDVINHNKKCFKYTDSVYSNFIRKENEIIDPNFRKMSGCAFLDTFKYYSQIKSLIEDCIKRPDTIISNNKLLFHNERILYSMMKKSKFKFIEEKDNLWERKLGGIHTSPNRNLLPTKHIPVGWFTLGHDISLQPYYEKYITTLLYKQMFPFFDKEYIEKYIYPLEQYWNINNE